MADPRDNYFDFDDLSQYSLRQRLTIRLADRAFYFFVRIIGATVRFEYSGLEHLRSIEESGRVPIYVSWHDRIVLGTKLLRDKRAIVITSQSFDGEYIARFVKRLGFGTIRGSSSRGGVRAMVTTIRAARSGFPIVFMVDGPRGPRYKVKPGPVVLAKQTGNPILAVSIEPKRYWTLKSWDKMQIPRPFSTALVSYGRPLVSESGLETEAGLQATLDELVQEGLRYSGRGR